MRKHYPLDPGTGVENAALLPWSDGVPATGVEGSYPGQALVTDQEAEILAAIDAAGLTRSGTDNTQIAQAMSIGLFLGIFGGTANTLTAVLPNTTIWPQLLAGMTFHGTVGTNPNTGAATLTLAGFAAAAGAQAILRKDGVTPLSAADLPAGAFVSFRYDGKAFRCVGMVRADLVDIIGQVAPITPPADAIFYVRPDGNDSNDGSANTAAKAFATVQTAVLKSITRYNLSGTSIAIKLGTPGTYNGTIALLLATPGSIIVQGDLNNPSQYVIQGAGVSGAAAISVAALAIAFAGVTFLNTSSISGMIGASFGATLTLQNTVFTTANAISSPHVYAGIGSNVSIAGTLSMPGFAGSALYADGGNIFTAAGTAVSFPGPTFSTTVVATNKGLVQFGQGTTMSGTATAKRFQADKGGSINTLGQGRYFIPGSTDGTADASTYGQYN